MFIYFTRNYVKALATLVTATFFSASMYADDCLLGQSKHVRTMLINSGTVGQSFTPCESGSLTFISLNLESNSEHSFSGALKVKDGKKVIAEQQVVIPSNGNLNEVRAWLANPPALEAGKNYHIEFQSAEGNGFKILFNPNNNYDDGGMMINGMYTNGDLAFEAGITGASDQADNCLPDLEQEDDVVSAPQIVGQSFELCQHTRIEAIRFSYRSVRPMAGNVEIVKSGETDGVVLGTFKFHAAPANPIGEVIAVSDEVIELQGDAKYDIRFRLDNGEGMPQDFQIWYGENDPYERGRLTLLTGVTENDLSFSLIRSSDEDTDDEPVDDEPMFAVFLDYPEHECTNAQPYYNHTHSFTGVTISIDAPICDDGKLEAIYFPGTIEGDGGEVGFELKNNQGSTVHSGTISADEQEEMLTVALDELSVLFYYKYTLEINVPEGTFLRIPSSDNPDHAGMRAQVNGSDFSRHISYAVGMKPYTFDFDAAQVDKEINVSVFPNPFASDFNVTIDGLDGRSASVSIYNFQGHEVFSTQLDGRSNSETLQLSPEMMTQRGYYTLRIDYGDHVKIETLVKQ